MDRREERGEATATGPGRKRCSEVKARSVIHDTCMKTCSRRERVREAHKLHNHLPHTLIGLNGKNKSWEDAP